jgi:hypothetical protein
MKKFKRLRVEGLKGTPTPLTAKNAKDAKVKGLFSIRGFCPRIDADERR